MDHAGIACAMKNAGVGVGLPDKGRAKLVIEDGCCVIYCAASDIGQGCLTVFCQVVSETTGLPLSKIRNAVANTENAPGLRYDIRFPSDPAFRRGDPRGLPHF